MFILKLILHLPRSTVFPSEASVPWFRNIVIWTLALTGLFPCDRSQAAERPRLGIIATHDLAAQVDLLTVLFSQQEAVDLIERHDMDLVLQEQGLSTESKETPLALGKLLRADGLLILSAERVDHIPVMRSRLIAVTPGIVLAESCHPMPQDNNTTVEREILQTYSAFLPKLNVSSADAVRLSFLGLHATLPTVEMQEAEQSLSILLLQRLMAVQDFFVLERSRMADLLFEKDFTAGPDEQGFWSGSHLLEGSLERLNSTSALVRVRLELRSPGEAPATVVTQMGTLDQLPDLAEQLCLALAANLHKQPPDSNWNPADEAARFTQLAQWANSAELYTEAARAADSAWALGDHSETLQCARIKAYSSCGYPSFSADTFFLRGLIERAKAPEALRGALRSLEIASRETVGDAPLSASMTFHLLASLSGASKVLAHFDGIGSALGQDQQLSQLKTLAQRCYDNLLPRLAPGDQNTLTNIRNTYGVHWGLPPAESPVAISSPPPTFPAPPSNQPPPADPAAFQAKQFLSLNYPPAWKIPDSSPPGYLSKIISRDQHLWSLLDIGPALESGKAILDFDPQTGQSVWIPVPQREAPPDQNHSSIEDVLEVTPSHILLLDRCFVMAYDRKSFEWRYLPLPVTHYSGIAYVSNSILVGVDGLGQMQDTRWTAQGLAANPSPSPVRQGAILRARLEAPENVEILAASARRPPQTTLDGISPFSVYNLFEGLNGKPWASVFISAQFGHVRLFALDDDWQELFPKQEGLWVLMNDSVGILIAHQWNNIVKCHWVDRQTGQINTWLDNQARTDPNVPEPLWVVPSDFHLFGSSMMTTDGQELFALTMEPSPPVAPGIFRLLWFRPGIREAIAIPMQFVRPDAAPIDSLRFSRGSLFLTPTHLLIGTSDGFWQILRSDLTAWVNTQAGKDSNP